MTEWIVPCLEYLEEDPDPDIAEFIEKHDEHSDLAVGEPFLFPRRIEACSHMDATTKMAMWYKNTDRSGGPAYPAGRA